MGLGVLDERTECVVLISVVLGCHDCELGLLLLVEAKHVCNWKRRATIAVHHKQIAWIVGAEGLAVLVERAQALHLLHIASFMDVDDIEIKLRDH